MARTDNTMPWRLLQQDRPYLPWTRILNTRSDWRPFKAGLRSAYWRSQRRRVHMDIGADVEPAPSRPRSSLDWKLW